MLPQFPIVTRCQECRSIFWIADAPVVGKYGGYDRTFIDTSDVSPAWKEAPTVQWLDLDDLSDALDMQWSAADERILLTKQWHRLNDPLRLAMQPPVRRNRHLEGQDARVLWEAYLGRPSLSVSHYAPDPMALANCLERLIPLLDLTSVDDRLLKVEALREMQRYDDALLLLKEAHEHICESIKVWPKRDDEIDAETEALLWKLCVAKEIRKRVRGLHPHLIPLPYR
jgi:hypothetical protein